MDKNKYFVRIKKAREEMAKQGIDVFFAGPSSNLFYLTGYGVKGDERLFLLVLPGEAEPFVLANLLYKEQAKTIPVNDLICWKDGDDPFGLLKAEMEKRNIPIKKAALEARIPALFSLPISQTFPGVHFELGSFMDTLRRFKDPAELDLIRRASRISDEALAAVIGRGPNAGRGSYWVGKTETDFAEELSAELRRRGVVSFGATVAVGANAALPHYGIGDAVIEKGKCLLVDFWGRLEGYYTDCTRTFFFGEPDREFEKIYNIVLEAHLAAEASVRPGNTLGDVDKAARSVIEKYGYGEYFTHRTGHGLGIDIHEGVSVNKGVTTPILPGMVFSVEPGIYFPGRFGVRIENLVATSEKGPEVLHAFPRELQTPICG